MRRTLIILAVVIVLLGAGGFVWWKYFSGGPSLAVSPIANTALPEAETASSGAGEGGAGAQSGAEADLGAGALAVKKITDRLTKIAEGPVAPGEAVIALPPADASSSPEVAVRFIERQSGNIYEYRATSGALTRISNKTLPGIEKALWTPDGRTAFVTYLSIDVEPVVNTYSIGADGSDGFFLPKGLADIAVSSTSVLMLASGATGSVASTAGLEGAKQTAVWSSPLSMLHVGFAGARGYAAFTKPSGLLAGYLFSIDRSGVFTRVAGPVPGLVALINHAGSAALVSSASGGEMRTMLVDMSTGARTALPLATIADKCAWTADDAALYCGVPGAPPEDATYPDDWYQGAVHFADRIWRIDVHGRFAQLVFDPSAVGVEDPVDAEAPALDPEATMLVFVNKNDGSLWAYRL